MNVGFTGTRKGMTKRQADMLGHFLRGLFYRAGEGREVVAHHGCCLGADAQFARLVKDHGGVRIVGHPCSIRHMTDQLAVTLCDEVRPVCPPLERNHNIVAECGILIGTPNTRTEEWRSGTWATVRYARAAMKAVRLILPDGAFVHDAPGPMGRRL